MNILFRNVFTLIIFFSLATPTISFSKSSLEIDAAIESALERFSEEIRGSDSYLDGARGILVIPKMIKAGVILGMEYGEGALIVDDVKVQYFRAFTTSLGLQVGVGSKDMIILFFDDEAMDDFLYSSGWEIGVDGAIAFLSMGIGGSIDTIESQDPIVGFVFGHKGIIAGMSMEGTKFTKIWPNADTDMEQDEIDEFNDEIVE